MKKLKKIVLKNFQIHEHLELEFCDGLNVIWGDNQKGKSSIIRAIYWAVTNKPTGNWMRRINKNGEKLKAEVKLVFDDFVLKRIKSDKVNRYCLDDENYDNFGFDVPIPIRQMLGMDFIKLGNTTIFPNIEMQDDPAFMIFETDAAKASLINRLTGVDLIEQAKNDFSKANSRLKKELKFVEENMIKNKKELRALPKVSDLKLECEEAKIKVQELEKKTEGFVKLLHCGKEIEEVQATSVSCIEEAKIKIDILLKCYSKLSEMQSGSEILRELAKEYVATTVCTKIPDFSIKDLQKAKELLDTSINMKELLGTYSSDLRKINLCIDKEGETESSCCKKLGKLNETHCPTCGKKL